MTYRLIDKARRWFAREMLAQQDALINGFMSSLAACQVDKLRVTAERDRLRKGLENIYEHSRRSSIMPFAPEVLRDYTREVIDNTQAPNRGRAYNTDLVSAAARWGYDFTKPPQVRA